MHKHSISGLTEPSQFEFDAIVIGSGFGGGTIAVRLAQSGKRVLVLERGRRWRGQNMPAVNAPPGAVAFPSLGEDLFFWGRRLWQPLQQRLGLFDIKHWRNLQGMVAAGVGGGSLIWANVVIEAPAEVFNEHWPREITRQTLEPYYKRAQQYLKPAFVPGTPGFAGVPIKRAALLKEAAALLGRRWCPVRVAVNFGDAGEPLPNGYGQAQQMGCNFCTRCSAGCPQNAKNTVDLSYLAEAEALGAEVRALHRVCHIAAISTGYRVYFERFHPDGKLIERGHVDAPRVILAAGTFGTTELLLRSRKAGLLPHVSVALGTRLSINGNVFSGAIRKGQTSNVVSGPDHDQNRGTAIASMIDYGDFVVEDFANPDWAGGIVGGSNMRRIVAFVKAVLGCKSRAQTLRKAQQDMLFYVGVGRDRAWGQLDLDAREALSFCWTGGIEHEPVLLDLHKAMAELARVQGREYVPNVFSIFNRPLTYHPLGGCPMSDMAETGVVDGSGRVYGYSGLYIADGSIVPTSLGRNPAFTIAALAERIAQQMLDRWDASEMEQNRRLVR